MLPSSSSSSSSFHDHMCTGALAVNDHMQTSDPDIYAAGDMVEVHHKVLGKQVNLVEEGEKEGRWG